MKEINEALTPVCTLSLSNTIQLGNDAMLSQQPQKGKRYKPTLHMNSIHFYL